MHNHGGDLDRAKAKYGGHDWIDLSTGINRLPWRLPPLPTGVWTALPDSTKTTALERAATHAWNATGSGIALAGAQAVIQLVPHITKSGRAAVLTPTYNGHAAALVAAGWVLTAAPDLSAMAGADLAVVVNPNNPDGRRWPPETLVKLSSEVGQLVVDESFIDAESGLSLAPFLEQLGERVIVLRSFGKFYGLAGLRLGFALTGPDTAARIRALAGPWAASGPAIAIGTTALADRAWQAATAARLHSDSAKLARLTTRAGWNTVGNTALFITVETRNARAAQEYLARARIWTRIFAGNKTWLRLGLPGPTTEWARLEQALAGCVK